ncbi:MAG TPA: DUF6629 family protein [Rhizomicrobium sp.]|jgi:hypothetical protein|nr:DUF6629 family protein [Rhizomicrobium sp.]
MCFSATASFSAAGILALAGVATLSKARGPRERPLAALPLVFALQQGIEGMLWRTVPVGHQAGRGLATGFAILALIVWPLFVPLAVGLAEKVRKRRRLILALMGPGLGVAGYSVMDIRDHPYMAWPAPHSLVYINDSPFPWPLMLAYLASVCAPPLLSSSPAIRWFGVVVTLGLAITLGFFFVSLVSVWCFFAAVASAILVGHFWRTKPVFESVSSG